MQRRLGKKTMKFKKDNEKRKDKHHDEAMPHTCILRLLPEEQERYFGYIKKHQEGKWVPKIDKNYYRRVSKYELDSRSVDWAAL